MRSRSADWWSGDGLERIDGCPDICKQRVSGRMAVELYGRGLYKIGLNMCHTRKKYMYVLYGINSFF